MKYSSVKSRVGDIYPPAFVHVASLFARDVATRPGLSDREVDSLIYNVVHHLSWQKDNWTSARIRDFFVEHTMLHVSGNGYLIDSERIQQVLEDWAYRRPPSAPKELVGRTDILREQHQRGEQQPTLDILTISVTLPYAEIFDVSGWTREQIINFLAWAGAMISLTTEQLEQLSLK